MTAADLERVAAIEKETGTPWSREQLAGQIRQPLNWQYVARNENGLVTGYVSGQTVAGEAEVFRIAVAKSFRRQGIGTLILQMVLDKLQQDGVQKIFLEVRESNHPAIHLYTQAGFRISGRRPGYYGNPPEDAVLMRWQYEKE